jgi:hypothetical protein
MADANGRATVRHRLGAVLQQKLSPGALLDALAKPDMPKQAISTSLQRKNRASRCANC